jgi:hypothetical protein
MSSAGFRKTVGTFAGYDGTLSGAVLPLEAAIEGPAIAAPEARSGRKPLST